MDQRTEGSTDGQSLLESCVTATKKGRREIARTVSFYFERLTESKEPIKKRVLKSCVSALVWVRELDANHHFHQIDDGLEPLNLVIGNMVARKTRPSAGQ